MLLSIVTPTFNSQDTILACCQSIDDQNYSDIEHIIIDGASTDDTIDVLQTVERPYRHVFSERDDGIYDAMNKGIAICKGDVIAILNSDDAYSSKHVFGMVMNELRSPIVDVTYGNLRYLNDQGVCTRIWRPGNFRKYKLYFGWMMPHPTMFVKRQIYEDLGAYDPKMKISADFDFILRALTSQLRTKYLDEFIVDMKIGGVSTHGTNNFIRKVGEDYVVLRRYSYFAVVVVLLKRLSKIGQFFKIYRRKSK